MKKEVKLYNMLFPIWLLMLFPQTWLVVLPGNFLIDSAVLLILMYALKIGEKRQFYINHIFKIYLFGIAADVIGTIPPLAMMLSGLGSLGDELYITIPGIFISAVCIFILNYRITFKSMDKRSRITASVVLAAATAPYTFLIPSSWLYSF